MNVERNATADLKALYVAHAAELRQTIARLAPELDAHDVLHEVFVVALQKGPALATLESPRVWLYGVAVKLARTRRRTARLRRFFGLDEALETAAVDSGNRSLEQRDAQRVVEAALATLTDAKRDVVVLHELRGLSGEEVAQALGIPLKTVWTRLFHARKALAVAVAKFSEEGSAS